MLNDTTFEWKEGWDAFWSAKTTKDCPYVPASEEGGDGSRVIPLLQMRLKKIKMSSLWISSIPKRACLFWESISKALVFSWRRISLYSTGVIRYDDTRKV